MRKIFNSYGVCLTCMFKLLGILPNATHSVTFVYCNILKSFDEFRCNLAVRPYTGGFQWHCNRWGPWPRKKEIWGSNFQSTWNCFQLTETWFIIHQVAASINDGAFCQIASVRVFSKRFLT